MAASGVLLTGSNRGIGLGLVKQLLRTPRPPAWIFATCRDPAGPRAQELRDLASKHPNLVLVKLDVADPSTITKAVKIVEEKLNGTGLNLLINNAGIYKPEASLETVDAEEMIRTYKTNAVGPLLMAQAALNMLTRCQALTYREAGILCVALHPGWVKTDMGGQEADLTVDRSVQGLLSVLPILSEKHHGTLLSWEDLQKPLIPSGTGPFWGHTFP
ncbi:C-factor-like isoform X4 [Pezoporus wallicus]|uniref:C-factor-like isoform X4 n=1 Tax=Pezoporus wallicus TaxID=35540 RepID=UPI00254A81E4|nr:C-factor-like isoform X4 [Pezoporus wallicus]